MSNARQNQKAVFHRQLLAPVAERRIPLTFLLSFYNTSPLLLFRCLWGTNSDFSSLVFFFFCNILFLPISTQNFPLKLLLPVLLCLPLDSKGDKRNDWYLIEGEGFCKKVRWCQSGQCSRPTKKDSGISDHCEQSNVWPSQGGGFWSYWDTRRRKLNNRFCSVHIKKKVEVLEMLCRNGQQN